MADCFKEPPAIPPARCHVEKMAIQRLPFHSYFRICTNLGKFRLTTLVAFTTVGGYILSPVPFDLFTLGATVTGIISCSMGANTFNQFLEYPFDSQMIRTRTRVLPMRLITPPHAFLLGCTFSIIGGAILFAYVNSLTAFLAIFNILLYSLCYTPLKRYSYINTHIGALVGALPPIIGWTAAVGQLDPHSFILGWMLFSWQFVHFNALSWNLRDDYLKAGYQMMAVVNPEKLRRSTLIHSIAIMVASLLLPFCGLTSQYFILTSFPINIYTLYSAFKFYQFPTSQQSTHLFHLSLIQITIIIILLIIHYKDSILFIDIFKKIKAFLIPT